jgi:hypothetical protein
MAQHQIDIIYGSLYGGLMNQTDWPQVRYLPGPLLACDVSSEDFQIHVMPEMKQNGCAGRESGDTAWLKSFNF